MIIDPEAEKALLSLIEEGVAASADALADVSQTRWTTQTLSISADQTRANGVESRLGGDKSDHYGAFISTPGAVFLLMLPKVNCSALASAFLHGRDPRPGAAPPREESCIAEIANIVINTIANTMANACDDAFLLSAPMMVLGNKATLMKIAIDTLKVTGETSSILTYVSMSSETLSSDCVVVLLLSPLFQGRILKALGQ
jgi:chemotaxis protein CheY-P-specific phosphatase CheC